MTGVVAALTGTAGGLVLIEDAAVDDVAAGTALARYALDPDGSVQHEISATGPVLQYNWLRRGDAGSYDCRATVNGGSLTSGSVGTWLDLGAGGGEWACVDTVVDGLPVECELTVEIRHSASGIVLDTAIIELSAERAV